jgi:broad specificity phosphatase PhoE
MNTIFSCALLIITCLAHHLTHAMQTTAVFVMVYGATEKDDIKDLRGYDGRSLTPEGQEHAKMLSELIQKYEFESVYCSHELAAQETAEIIASAVKVTVIKEDRLRKRNQGNREGVVDLEAFAKKYPNHTIEPTVDHVARVQDFIKEQSRQNIYPVIMLVHGSVMQSIGEQLGMVSKINLEEPTTTIFVLMYNPDYDSLNYCDSLNPEH